MGAVHELKVKSPYQILNVEDIKIENKPGEHGYLYLKCLIDDSIKFESAINASTDDKICVYEEQENKILFNGIVQNIRTSNVNGIYYLEIQALTSSFDMDIKEKSRSFQNARMTYDELIKTILKDYPGRSYYQCTGKGQSIGKPLFQYKETDWSFIKRIASELNSELYCDIIQLNNMFYFGRPNEESFEIEDMKCYKACKDLKRFREAGGYDAGHDTDYFYYDIERRNRYEIGSDISFKGKKLYVGQYSASAVQGEVIYKYRLRRKNGVWQTQLYNPLIGGAALEGEVLAVEGEKVKLHLGIDEKQNKDEASWFTYAPPTGNVMYSMPVVGTSARLYFPNETSEDPIVTGCVRKNGSSCAKMSDTTKRYFGTEHGSEIEMLPDALNIKGGSKEPLSISFDDNKGVTLTSHKKLKLNADDEIIFRTPKSIKINAPSQIFASMTGTESGFSIENEFHFLSNNVIQSGTDVETYPPFDDEPKKAPNPKAAGFNWGLLALGVIAAVAIAASVLTFGAGAVLAAAAVGAIISVGTTAISDAINGRVSSPWTYFKNAMEGAVIGAIFGPAFGLCGITSEMGTSEITAQFLKTLFLGGAMNCSFNTFDQVASGENCSIEEQLKSFRDGALVTGAFAALSPWIAKGINKILNGKIKSVFDKLDLNTATKKQKGNYGEAKANDNIVKNKSFKHDGYKLKSIGRDAPTSPNDKIVKGIDGLYKNTNTKSNIKYVIDEAKFGSSKLGSTKDGPQMSDDWIRKRVLKAVNGDKVLKDDILDALDNNQVERVLSKVDSKGNVVTYRLSSKGKIIGTWPPANKGGKINVKR